MSNYLLGASLEDPDIIGEQTRGSDAVAGSILGELMDKSPALASYVSKRMQAAQPTVVSRPITKARDWQIDLPSAFGAAGTSTTISVNPQCLFRGEKVMATDTYSTAGYGTTIGTIIIGNKLQRPVGSGSTLTAFFASNALGNGIKWDTCDKALSIAVTVNFIAACTFYMSVYGKAVL